MTKLAFTAALAASLSFFAVAPAVAQDTTVEVSYSDLDLASPAGAKVLVQRVQAACERPDIRDLRAMADWQACRQSARNSTMEQLNGKGVAFDSAPFVGA